MKRYVIYAIEVIVAIIIINFSLEAFLIYFFFVVLWKLDYLRAVVRVLSVSNEVKTTAVIRKLNITDEEVEAIWKETENALNEKQLASLKRDMAEVMKQ